MRKLQKRTIEGIKAEYAAGASVREIAHKRKLARSKVQSVIDGTYPKPQPGPQPPAQPKPAPAVDEPWPVQSVVDLDPSPLFKAGQDAPAEFQPEPQPEPQPELQPGPQPPAQPEPQALNMTPAQVVDLVESLVSLGLRVAVSAKGGEWTPELESACRFNASERSRLSATAPLVAPMLSQSIGSSPWTGVGLFALCAADIVFARFNLARSATAKAVEPEPVIKPQPWAPAGDFGPVTPPRA